MEIISKIHLIIFYILNFLGEIIMLNFPYECYNGKFFVEKKYIEALFLVDNLYYFKDGNFSGTILPNKREEWNKIFQKYSIKSFFKGFIDIDEFISALRDYLSDNNQQEIKFRTDIDDLLSLLESKRRKFTQRDF